MNATESTKHIGQQVDRHVNLARSSQVNLILVQLIGQSQVDRLIWIATVLAVAATAAAGATTTTIDDN